MGFLLGEVLGNPGPFPSVAQSQPQPPGSLSPSLTRRGPGWSHSRGSRQVWSWKTGFQTSPQVAQCYVRGFKKRSPTCPLASLPRVLKSPIQFPITPSAACQLPASCQHRAASSRPHPDLRLSVHLLCSLALTLTP